MQKKPIKFKLLGGLLSLALWGHSETLWGQGLAQNAVSVTTINDALANDQFETTVIKAFSVARNRGFGINYLDGKAPEFPQLTGEETQKALKTATRQLLFRMAMEMLGVVFHNPQPQGALYVAPKALQVVTVETAFPKVAALIKGRTGVDVAQVKLVMLDLASVISAGGNFQARCQRGQVTDPQNAQIIGLRHPKVQGVLEIGFRVTRPDLFEVALNEAVFGSTAVVLVNDPLANNRLRYSAADAEAIIYHELTHYVDAVQGEGNSDLKYLRDMALIDAEGALGTETYLREISPQRKDQVVWPEDQELVYLLAAEEARLRAAVPALSKSSGVAAEVYLEKIHAFYDQGSDSERAARLSVKPDNQHYVYFQRFSEQRAYFAQVQFLKEDKQFTYQQVVEHFMRIHFFEVAYDGLPFMRPLPTWKKELLRQFYDQTALPAPAYYKLYGLLASLDPSANQPLFRGIVAGQLVARWGGRRGLSDKLEAIAGRLKKETWGAEESVEARIKRAHALIQADF